MVRKNNRLIIYILACSAIGVLLGGTASSAELNQCLNADVPSNECLIQDPTLNTLQGMSFGLMAGAGAAFSTTWQISKKEK